MKTIAILSIALLVGVAALSFSEGQSASACATTNSISTSLASGSVTVRADGTFDYVLNVTWNVKSKPAVGQEWLVEGHGLKDVSYTPTYFFPDNCSGSVQIFVKGRKSGIVGPEGRFVDMVVEVGGASTGNYAQKIVRTMIP